MKKHLFIISLLIIISPSFLNAQDYIKELPQEKNQLFYLLKVKVETIQEENSRTTDSLKVWEKITKNYYDTRGYLVKKEKFDSSLTLHSHVNEYKYDRNGNFIEVLINGSLIQKREYNDFDKITNTYYYNHGKISKTYFYKYDFYENLIEILIKYSSGRIDTLLVRHYNYDLSITPPRIINDTTYFREFGDIEISISELDSIGRCTKVITLHPDSTYNSTTLYFYNDKNLFDSTIQYSNEGVEKYIRWYDKSYRLTKTLDYSETDSIQYLWNFYYDEKIFTTIDSLFKDKDLDLTNIADFEKTGVVLATLHKSENEIRKNVTEYYPIGLIKSSIVYDYKFQKIEKKFYEYVFY